jgi:hypothetical protein
MLVTTTGGLKWEAPHARGIVRQMRREPWNAPPDKPQYMLQAAKRVAQQTGASIRCDTPRHFLDDLATAGLVKISQRVTQGTAGTVDVAGRATAIDTDPGRR